MNLNLDVELKERERERERDLKLIFNYRHIIESVICSVTRTAISSDFRINSLRSEGLFIWRGHPCKQALKLLTVRYGVT